MANTLGDDGHVLVGLVQPAPRLGHAPLRQSLQDRHAGLGPNRRGHVLDERSSRRAISISRRWSREAP
jgi:hypothetical protein